MEKEWKGHIEFVSTEERKPAADNGDFRVKSLQCLPCLHGQLEGVSETQAVLTVNIIAFRRAREDTPQSMILGGIPVHL